MNNAKAMVLLSSATPPKEFRIFKKGLNKTTKGDFLFDDTAAASVMAAWKKHAVDMMIDLEHLSTDDEAKHYNPDAFGWCKLELRSGELWAVNVTWTPGENGGEARLRELRQRYVSPAFTYNEDSSRILELYNIAICAIPATNEAPALVAASARKGQKIGTLTVEVGKMELKQLAALLGLKEDATMEDCAAAIKALQGKEEEASDDDKDKDPKEDKEEASDDVQDEVTSKLSGKAQAVVLAALAGNKILKDDIAQIKKSLAKDRVEAIMNANADKIPKSMEKLCRKMTPENLQEFVDAMPSKGKLAREPIGKGGDKTKPEDAEQEVTLTQADRDVIRLSGGGKDAEKKFLEQKKKSHERDRERQRQRERAEILQN